MAPLKNESSARTSVAELSLWQQLLEPAMAPLLDAADHADDFDAPTLERLRRHWPAELVAVAVELSGARRKAAGKFPNAADLIADCAGVEQATSHVVAEHKARRFAQIGAAEILDLCCGIGGDAMSLACIAAVEAVDINPLRAWMAHRNAGCPARVADVATVQVRDAIFHLDPSRRDSESSRRMHRYEEYEPGPPVIERLLRDCRCGAVKLGPGVDFSKLPACEAGEIELVNENGALVQAVLWTGRLAQHPGQRTATRLPDGDSFTGLPAPAPIGEMKSILFAVDTAIERADLMGALCRQLGLEAIHPALGLLSADQVIASPWLTAFELLAFMPWRPRKVRQWLTEHSAGIIEVKTRGRVVEPDIIQRQLRGKGSEPFVVFILRMDRRVHALITRRT